MARQRLDTVMAMDPGHPDPCGTKAELKRAKLPLLKYGSCSLPGKANRGCMHFDHPEYGPCPIRALLAQRSRPGPENVAFVQVKSPTVWKRDITTCSNYMSTYDRQDEKHARYKIIAIGGDPMVVNVRGSEEVDPGNPRSRMKTKLIPMKVDKFERPAERFAGVIETLDMAEEMKRATALERGEALADGLDEAEDSGGAAMDEDDFNDGEPLPAEEESEFETVVNRGGDDDDEPESELPPVMKQATGKLERRGRRKEVPKEGLDGLDEE